MEIRPVNCINFYVNITLINSPIYYRTKWSRALFTCLTWWNFFSKVPFVRFNIESRSNNNYFFWLNWIEQLSLRFSVNSTFIINKLNSTSDWHWLFCFYAFCRCLKLKYIGGHRSEIWYTWLQGCTHQTETLYIQNHMKVYHSNVYQLKRGNRNNTGNRFRDNWFRVVNFHNF